MIIAQGAEATIFKIKDKVVKDRIPKAYRHPELDNKIRRRRTKSEGKILEKASKIINCPPPLVNPGQGRMIHMPFIDGKKLSQELNNLDNQLEVMRQIGESTSKLHKENIIHGDLTTSNMILKEGKNSIRHDPNSEEDLIKGTSGSVYFIDFGLGYQNGKYEDKAVDIHLLKQALEAKHFQNWKELFKAFEKGYLSIDKEESKKVLERLTAVEKRGRYKH